MSLTVKFFDLNENILFGRLVGTLRFNMTIDFSTPVNTSRAAKLRLCVFKAEMAVPPPDAWRISSLRMKSSN